MVETIEKIRKKVSKLLNRIADLENKLKDAHQTHTDFKSSLAMDIITKKDELLNQNTSSEQISFLDDLLSKMGVTPLAAPLDKLADFIEIVGTKKDTSKNDGVVVEVVKKGYLKDDELLRPTHVIIVKND